MIEAIRRRPTVSRSGLRRWARSALATPGIFVALFGAVVGAEPFDPFLAPENDFRARIHALALAPVEISAEIEHRDELARRVEAAIMQRFESAQTSDYRLLESSHYAKVWRRMSDRLGGAFDDRTGEARADVLPLVAEHTRRELALRHGADAVLIAELSEEELGAGGTSEGWVAGGELLSWRGGPIPNLYRYVPQRVLGHMLSIEIRDAMGRRLYGIQVPIGWHRVYFMQGYEDRSRGEGIDSDARLDRALGVLLDPLLSGHAAVD